MLGVLRDPSSQVSLMLTSLGPHQLPCLCTLLMIGVKNRRQLVSNIAKYFGTNSILVGSQDIQQLLIQTASGALSATSRDPKFADRTNKFLTVLI